MALIQSLLCSKAYNKYFQVYFKLDASEIIRVEKCDAYFTKDKLTALIEYKFDVDFSDVLTRAKVIAQALIYYKKIVDKGKDAIPNVVFIGDVNECFCFKAKHFSKLMDIEGVDYGIVASSVGSQMKLVQAIIDDVELQHDIFIINPQKDSMSYICEKMAAMSFDKDAKIPITLKNVTRVFEAFSTKICTDKKYSSNEIVGLFIDAIRYPEKRIIGGDYLVVPPYKPMKVDMMKAIGLFKFFGKPSDSEAKELTQIYDTLVKDDERRAKGFFNTKSIWVDLAHKYLADFFKSINFVNNDNWEGSDNVICWDPAAGTKALTKEFRFKNLYVSTINQSELNASQDLSTEAKETFVYDFLNDPISKLPKSLQDDLAMLRDNPQTKICVLMNPPYGHADAIKSGDMQHRSLSVVATDMKNAGMKGAGEEMFVQFLFKINQICEHFKIGKNQVVIGTFSKPTFMCKESFEDFRKFWLEEWKYESGFMFNASEFEGCSDQWPVSFSVWHNVKSVEKKLFKHEVYEASDDGNVNLIGEKTLYNIDGEQLAKNWIYDKTVKNTVSVPTTADGFTLLEDTQLKMAPGFLGFYGGTLRKNILTIPFKYGHGFSILPYNIDKTVSYFAARNAVEHKWQNDKDVYRVPNETHPKWQEFVKDSLVYSLFISDVSAIKGKNTLEFANNFYPFSKVQTYGFFGSQLMKNEVDEKRWCLANGKFDNLTPEGKAVLDAFAACIKASAPFRNDFGKAHPELQLEHWDAGYRQLRDLFKETCPEELKKFRAALKALKVKMAPMVYELGFLRK